MATSAPVRWKPITGGVTLLVALGVVLWFTARKTDTVSGEQDVEIRLICVACGHTFGTTFEKMGTLVAEARAKGYPHMWEGMRGPIALCRSCGKPTVFRSRPCPKCDKPVLFETQTLDGKMIVPTCKGCGWVSDQKPGAGQPLVP